jgi:WD40 repeat protein
MKELKPKFVLTRVYEDGSQDKPEIAPLTQTLGDTKMNRRGFLGTGLTASAALVVMSGDDWKSKSTPRLEDRECGKMYAHSDDVIKLAISGNGSTLVSGSKDNTVKCWDLSNRALVKTFESDNPSRIAINPKAMKIAFGISGAGNELRTVPAGKLIKTFDGQCYEFTPDNAQLIIARKGYVDVYNLNGGTLRSTLVVSEGDISSLAVSPNGNCIAVGTDSKGVILLDRECNEIKTLDNNYNSTLSLAFSPDGQYLATLMSPSRSAQTPSSGSGRTSSSRSSANTASLVVFGIPGGEQLYKANKNADGLMFSHDGQLLFWEKPAIGALQTGSFSSKDMLPLKNEITMVPAPDGKCIITGGRGGSIKMWHLPDLIFSQCFMDVNCSGEQIKGSTYNYTDEWGQTFSYTLPCGSPIPANAVCTCNCVPGKMESVCTCDRVCTCNSVCTCLSVGGGRYCTCNRVCVCMAV